MKQLLAIILAIVIGIPAIADDYEYLTFEKTDGSTKKITSVGTVITFSDNTLDAVNGTESQTISLADLVKMYFSDGSSSLMGDVNDDGEISVADVMLIISYVLGDLSDSSVFYEDRADLDGNGTISVADISNLVQIILTQDS